LALTISALVSAAPTCCMRLIRSTAVTGASTRPDSAGRRPDRFHVVHARHAEFQAQGLPVEGHAGDRVGKGLQAIGPVHVADRWQRAAARRRTVCRLLFCRPCLISLARLRPQGGCAEDAGNASTGMAGGRLVILLRRSGRRPDRTARRPRLPRRCRSPGW
jgi:hypothetical protein